MRLIQVFVKTPKRLFAYFLKNYSIVLYIYNTYFRLKNRKKFFKEIDHRKNLSLFDYKELVKPIPYYPLEPVKDSNFYGHSYSFKKFAGVNKITHSIEHGLYLGNYVPFATFLKTTKKIITFSENRKEHLTKGGVEKAILTVGPYIHYAESLLSEKKIDMIKKSIGKTFLLFPSHSIDNYNVKFEVNDLIKRTKYLATEYNTILVCLYYQDILNDMYVNCFINAGFKIVTAGHKLDLNFISRLKSIIKLADITASNNIGTHTGYCIYLNKEHLFINQDIKHTSNSGKKSKQPINVTQSETLHREKKEVINALLSGNNKACQMKVIDKYWGFSSIRSKEEIKILLSQ